MKNKRRILGIIAAVVMAMVGTAALVGYVNSAKNKALAGEALTDVYVVNKLVPKGADVETIKSSVSVDKVPNRLVQPGAITDLGVIGGEEVAGADLQPGDQLLEARLTQKDSAHLEVTDKVQVAAQLTPERAVGGTIAKGDMVGVYLSFDPFDTAAPGTETTTPAKTPSTTHLEFQHVLVTNVQTTSEPVVENKDSTGAKIQQVSGSQYIVTLALTPAQSERFVFATEFGHVWLANEPASVSDDGTKLITLGNAFSVVK
jgi:pilus assembly protein CpaB